jgi:hypothetical protein
MEKLRQVGTPLELIQSYIVAGNEDAANLAFTSSVLEVLHEAMPYHTVFVTDHWVWPDSDDIALGAEPIHNQLPSTYGRLPVTDSVQASLYALVHRISQEFVDLIRTAVKSKTTPVWIGLIPQHSAGRISINDHYLDYKFTLAVKAAHQKA